MKVFNALFCSLLWCIVVYAQDFSAYVTKHVWTITPEKIASMTAAEGANFDESKVPDFKLPALFKLGNTGATVTTVLVWEGQRRRQMIDSISRVIYGISPPKPSDLAFKVIQEDKNAMGGKATLKRVEISFKLGSAQPFKFNLNFFIPNNRTGRAPLFLMLNHRGASAADYTRQSKGDFWPAEYVIGRGYAIGAVNVSAEVTPDNPTTTTGILVYYKNNHSNPSQFTWGAISAWAWAGSRCVDYLMTDPDIDTTRLAVIGHSRGGKTAYWCGAQDTRFALTCPNGSGKSGPGLIRRMYSRGIAKSVSNFPHWFSPVYITYDGRENELPFDGHFFAALVAPRGLHCGDGADDILIDPRGTWLAVDSATAAWGLYGKTIHLPEKQPLVNDLYINGPIGYHMRDGGHGLLLWDWKMYLDHADSLLSGIPTSVNKHSNIHHAPASFNDNASVNVYGINGRALGTYANKSSLVGQQAIHASQPLILTNEQSGRAAKSRIQVQ